MFLSIKNIEEIKSLISIDNHRFISCNKLDKVEEDLEKINSLEDLESFYNIYKDTFSNLCSFKLNLLISKYKLSYNILVLKFIGRIKYRIRNKKLNIKY